MNLERIRTERQRLAELLRTETVGGAFLVVAAIAAVVAANSPLHHAYVAVRDWAVGPAALDLHLTVGEWASDGLLVIFFFLAGLELKHEFVSGDLRDPRRAIVPVAAAVGGMAVPAVVYALINAHDGAATAGWAIPTATDIAFALAVLAVVGRHLPPVLRTFLLTLAVVDDLLAIVVIAVFYAEGVRFALLAGAVAAWLLFTVVIHVRRRPAWLIAPVLAVLAVACWVLMHASGVHATVAGVLLGFAIPVIGRRAKGSGADRGQAPPLANTLDEVLRPLSAGVAVPIFAFFAAGMPIGGWSGLMSAAESSLTIGVVAGLVVGKTVGICVTTIVVGAIVRSSILRALKVVDLLGLAVLGGIGFTVSLLIGELAFGSHAEYADDARIGVLAGSVIAAVLGGVILGLRSRTYRLRSERTAD